MEEIQNLELVHWVEEEKSIRVIARGGKKVDRLYEKFEDVYDALLKIGPLVVASDEVDVVFTAPTDYFNGNIVALRQSGRNVRRFLIKESDFDYLYGTFQNCLDHIRSNNAVDCTYEIKALRDLAIVLKLSPTEIDPNRNYHRMDVDIVAALQMLKLLEEGFEDDIVTQQIFELGYCVGRLFSSAQNYATLEPDAARAAEYAKSYRDRGKKGKSRDRKSQRLEVFMTEIEKLGDLVGRMKEPLILDQAFQNAVESDEGLWKQGRGQQAEYETLLRSETEYRVRYYRVFNKTA